MYKHFTQLTEKKNKSKQNTTYNCPMLQGTLTTKAGLLIAPDVYLFFSFFCFFLVRHT